MDIPDYQLLRRIGKGGYGEVWLARALTGEYRALEVSRTQVYLAKHRVGAVFREELEVLREEIL